MHGVTQRFAFLRTVGFFLRTGYVFQYLFSAKYGLSSALLCAASFCTGQASILIELTSVKIMEYNAGRIFFAMDGIFIFQERLLVATDIDSYKILHTYKLVSIFVT